MLFLIASTIILAVTLTLFFLLQTPVVFFFGALALWFVVDLKVFNKGKNINSEGAGFFIFTLFGTAPPYFLEGNLRLAYCIAFSVLHFVKMLSWLKFFDDSIGEILKNFRFYLGIIVVIAGYVALPFFVTDNSWIASLLFAIAIPSYIVTSAMVAHEGESQLYDGEDDSDLFFGGMGFWGVNFLKYLGIAIASPFILIYKLLKLIWDSFGMSQLREELGIWFWILFAVLIVFAVLALTGLIAKMADASTEIFDWIFGIFDRLGEFPVLNWFIGIADKLADSFLIVLLAVFVLAGFILCLVVDIVWLILCFLFAIISLIVCGLLIFVFYTVLPGAAGIACLVLLIIAFTNCDKERDDITLFVLLLLFILASVAAYYLTAFLTL